MDYLPWEPDGLVGLGLFYLAMTLPALRFVRRFPARLWGDPQLAAASLTAVVSGPLHDRLPVERFPEHGLCDSRRWTDGYRARAIPQRRGSDGVKPPPDKAGIGDFYSTRPSPW